MPHTTTDQELFSHIDEAIRTVLPVDEPITPLTTLAGNLGAESIDFLDISCEIEKQLNVTVDFRKLFKQRQSESGSAAPDICVQDLVEHIKGLRANAVA